MWINILLVASGSMFGGVARYLLSGWIRQLIPGAFPLGTFLVNMTGCFLIGIFSGLATSLPGLNPSHRLLFAVGFCGSFTTFSTFSLENLELLSSRAYTLLALNATLSIVFGLLAAWLGYLLARTNGGG